MIHQLRLAKLKMIWNPNDFVNAMLELGEITQEELDDKLPHGAIVTNLCHNACVYMCKIALKKCDEEMLKHVFIVTGSYALSGMFEHLRKEHSWMEYRCDKKTIVFDLTISQFTRNDLKIYIGTKSSRYNEY